MTRTDKDSWDLASSVGATATMVAAARALASQETNPIIRRPLRRTTGTSGRPRLLHPDGRRRLVPSEADQGAANGHEPGDRYDGGAHQVLRRVLPQRGTRRDSPSGDPGRRPRRARLPAGLAARQCGLRSRSARGHRVQDTSHVRPGRRADRATGAPSHRSARRLAGALRSSGFDPTHRRRGARKAC